MRRHLEHADALDTTAWQALGVGSIVLGLGVAGDLTGWGLFFALIGYVLLVVGVYLEVRVTNWKTTPEGDDFWRDGWFFEPAEVDLTVVDALVEAEPHNRKRLANKAVGVRLALLGLVIEIVALTVSAALT